MPKAQMVMMVRESTVNPEENRSAHIPKQNCLHDDYLEDVVSISHFTSIWSVVMESLHSFIFYLFVTNNSIALLLLLLGRKYGHFFPVMN